MTDSRLSAIILVEDDENDIELTRIAIERAGIRNPVKVLHDGEEALDFLFRRGVHAGRSEAFPGLVLLDKKLPKIDGHEVLAAVRGDPALRHIPIVMLTSSREEQDLLRSYDLGVNAYVVKPVKFEDFMDAIRDIGAFWVELNEPRP